MANIGYFATYATFETLDKEAGQYLLGVNNVIGAVGNIEHEYSAEADRTWVVNPFGERIGYITSAKVTEEIDLCNARGYTTVALLALVAFSEKPDPGHYWGEVVIISYDPAYKQAFSVFVEGISNELARGIRPSVNLGKGSLQKIVDAHGNWLPNDRVAMPKKTKGTAWVKTQRGSSEGLVEQARQGNKGCVVATWIFWILVAVLVLAGLHSCGVF